MSKLLFLKSVETLIDVCEWKEELCGQINERIIFASIDRRDDAEREEYRRLLDDLRFAEMTANGYNLGYPSHLRQ